jgi:hypothetical protein
MQNSNEDIIEELLFTTFEDAEQSGQKKLDVNLLLNSCDSPETLFLSIAPHLFNSDPQHQESAQTLLESIIAHKPILLPRATSCILKQIQDSLKDDGNSDLNISSNFLKLLLLQLQHSDMKVVKDAVASVLCIVSHRPNFIPIILQELLAQKSTLLSLEKSTVMIRTYTLIFDIVEITYKSRLTILQRVYQPHNTFTDEWNSLMESFMKGISSDEDPLMQMSLLELLEQHCTRNPTSSDECSFLLLWMTTNHLLNKILLHMVGFPNLKEMHPFCAGAALRLLGMMMATSTSDRDVVMEGAEDMNKSFVNILIHYGRLMNGEVEKIGYIDGITTWISSCVSLKLVMENDELMEEWLSLRRGSSKLKAVVINSVAKVLFNNLVADGDDEEKTTDDLKMKLYKSIGTVNDVGSNHDSTEIIMTFVKGQVVELRFAAYDLLTTVAKLNKAKGAHVLMNFGGFFEFLINRNQEMVKEGKELKFTLVKAIWDSEVKGLLADNIVKVLAKVVSDGPYFVARVRDVALE